MISGIGICYMEHSQEYIKEIDCIELTIRLHRTLFHSTKKKL